MAMAFLSKITRVVSLKKVNIFELTRHGMHQRAPGMLTCLPACLASHIRFDNCMLCSTLYVLFFSDELRKLSISDLGHILITLFFFFTL